MSAGFFSLREMASKREEKLPPRRFLNSAFYHKVQPWKHTAPMQKDIHPQFWDLEGRGYEPVPVAKAPKEWKHLIESRMRNYSEEKHLFCWVIPGKDRKLPRRDDSIQVTLSLCAISFFTAGCQDWRQVHRGREPRLKQTGLSALTQHGLRHSLCANFSKASESLKNWPQNRSSCTPDFSLLTNLKPLPRWKPTWPSSCGVNM